MPDIFTLQTLAAELAADPDSLGYSSLPAGDDQGRADKLNAPDPNSQPVPAPPIDAVTAVEFIHIEDWRALSQADRDYVQVLASVGRVNLRAPFVLTALEAIFAADTQTGAALRGVGEVHQSRAEVLWGVGFSVSADQVGQALRPPAPPAPPEDFSGQAAGTEG